MHLVVVAISLGDLFEQLGMKLRFLTGFMLLFCSAGSGLMAQRSCGLDSVRAAMMGIPDALQSHHLRMDAMRDLLPDHVNRAECENILLVPVAAHFQDTGIPMDCAIEMALSQVETLNADFAGTNGDVSEWFELQPDIWPGIANGESCIQFCLATLNHPGGFGLSDGDYAVTLDATDGDFDAAWSGYLNFWVRSIGGGTLGYSPLGGQGNGDGVTVDPSYFGNVSCGGNTVSAPYNLGRTMTHEVGHYMSLDHPWGFGGCGSTDGIADTPVTDAQQFGCPNGQTIVTCTEPILWPTYMEYCDDACLFMFSAGQVAQMDAYAEANLSSMWNLSATTCQEAICMGFDVDVVTQDETCTGSDGFVVATPIGGTGPYAQTLVGAGGEGDGSWAGLGEGSYTLIVEDANECPFELDIELVREEASLSLTAIAHEYCSNGQGMIEVMDAEPSELEFSRDGMTWQETGLFQELSAGQYVISVRNENGCTGQVEVALINESALTVDIQLKGVSCDWVDNGEITVRANGAVPPVAFDFNDGQEIREELEIVQKFASLPPGDYQIRVLDAEGCTSESEVTLGLDYSSAGDDCPCAIFVPNAFTPDKDGRNEALAVSSNCPMTDVRMEVFDRWGQKVFESTNMSKWWNGTGQSNVGQGEYYVPSDVYVYRLAYRWGVEGNEEVELQFQTGTITVIR